MSEGGEEREGEERGGEERGGEEGEGGEREEEEREGDKLRRRDWRVKEGEWERKKDGERTKDQNKEKSDGGRETLCMRGKVNHITCSCCMFNPYPECTSIWQKVCLKNTGWCHGYILYQNIWNNKP